MKDYQLQLIDSTYSAQNAREVLASLLSDKIKFLTHKIFSEAERFGTDSNHYKNRIKALKEEKDMICSALRKLEATECEVEISCKVDIKVHEAVLA